MSTKSVMKYSGIDASSLFPVQVSDQSHFRWRVTNLSSLQVSALCDGIDGSVSPWVTDSATNTSDVNSQYHDFRAYTNDSRPDWYYEQMASPTLYIVVYSTNLPSIGFPAL